MAKPLKKDELPQKERIEAVTIIRVSELLSQSFKLTIEDGRVVACDELTRAPDVPALAISHATRGLWQQFRTNRTHLKKPGLAE